MHVQVQALGYLVLLLPVVAIPGDEFRFGYFILQLQVAVTAGRKQQALCDIGLYFLVDALLGVGPVRAWVERDVGVVEKPVEGV